MNNFENLKQNLSIEQMIDLIDCTKSAKQQNWILKYIKNPIYKTFLKTDKQNPWKLRFIKKTTNK